jgi:exosortase A
MEIKMTTTFFNDSKNIAWVTVVCGVLLLLAIYYETLFSMVDIWQRSETFAHGFLIFPISFYLIWRKRTDLSNLTPLPEYLPLIIFFGLGFGWLLAYIINVLVVQQFSLIAMIIVFLWIALGRSMAWEIAFPLGFLFFAVPFGEFLIAPLMDFTADFTVGMLELTGIPVFREGTFFSIPSGDWSVVEGCSGLRYLIASITLGFLYSYLSYHSYLRRVAFMLLACIFPVIANGLRAYMIVMIAHLSDMRLALGVDHFIYGWVFFGLVMLLLFWIGSFWIDNDGESTKISLKSIGAENNVSRVLQISAISLLSALFWTQWGNHIRQTTEASIAPQINLSLPQAVLPWHISEDTMTNWSPRYIGSDAEKKVVYANGSATIAVYIFYYHNQEQGRELINSQNVLIPQKHPIWKMPEEKLISIHLGKEDAQILRGRLKSNEQNLLTWRWNIISGQYTVNQYLAKILEAKDKLLGNLGGDVGIVLATPYVDASSEAKAGEVLQSFVDAMLPSIEASLAQAEAH